MKKKVKAKKKPTTEERLRAVEANVIDVRVAHNRAMAAIHKVTVVRDKMAIDREAKVDAALREIKEYTKVRVEHLDALETRGQDMATRIINIGKRLDQHDTDISEKVDSPKDVAFVGQVDTIQRQVDCLIGRADDLGCRADEMESRHDEFEDQDVAMQVGLMRKDIAELDKANEHMGRLDERLTECLDRLDGHASRLNGQHKRLDEQEKIVKASGNARILCWSEDLPAIKEVLGEPLAKIRKRLDEHLSDINEHDKDINDYADRLDKVEPRLNGHAEQLAEIQLRLDTFEKAAQPHEEMNAATARHLDMRLRSLEHAQTSGFSLADLTAKQKMTAERVDKIEKLNDDHAAAHDQLTRVIDRACPHPGQAGPAHSMAKRISLDLQRLLHDQYGVNNDPAPAVER